MPASSRATPPRTAASSRAAQPTSDSDLRACNCARARNAAGKTSPVAPLPCSQPASHLSATSALIPLRSADARGGNGPRTGRSVTHSRSRAKRRDDFIETARLITPGRLNFEAPGSRSPTRAERALLAVRALGPWSLAHLITRALGFSAGVPPDDTGVTNGLPALLKIEAGPTATPPDG